MIGAMTSTHRNMKPRLKLNQTSRLCAALVALYAALIFTAQAKDAPGPVEAAAPKSSAPPIPWSQIGAKAGAEYQGEGLVAMPTGTGARLRCVFQKMEGEVTRDGLWLTSTVEGSQTGRFSVIPTAVGRAANVAQPSRLRLNGASSPRSASGDETAPELAGEDACATAEVALPRTGTVQVADKLARFLRPGLTEEYTVSMDGVRQDFIIEQRPAGPGQLRLELVVLGAKVEPLPDGARLVLENSGRKIAYSRLRVTDAMGKELTARMEVLGSAAAPASDHPSTPGRPFLWQNPTMDQRTQLKVSQATQRFFRKLQAATSLQQNDLVMLMLASTWGQAQLAGLSTPQLIEWALKNWAGCDKAKAQTVAQMVVTGQGTDVTTPEAEAFRKRLATG